MSIMNIQLEKESFSSFGRKFIFNKAEGSAKIVIFANVVVHMVDILVVILRQFLGQCVAGN